MSLELPHQGQDRERGLWGTGSQQALPKYLLKDMSKRRTFVPNALRGRGGAHECQALPWDSEKPFCVCGSPWWWCHLHKQARSSLALKEKPQPGIREDRPNSAHKARPLPCTWELAQGCRPGRVGWSPELERAHSSPWGCFSVRGSEQWAVGDVLGPGLGRSGWRGQ